jgi:hypothetical protein
MAKTTNFPLREINQAGVLAAESISHLRGLFAAIKRAAAEPGGHAEEIKNLCDIGMYLADDYTENVEAHIEGLQCTMRAKEVQ